MLVALQLRQFMMKFQGNKMELLSIGETNFIVRNLFFKKEISFGEIEKVVVSNTLSLFDEVAIFIYLPQVLLVADSNPEFFNMAEKLKLNDVLGQDWYKKAEQGERFELRIRV